MKKKTIDRCLTWTDINLTTGTILKLKRPCCTNIFDARPHALRCCWYIKSLSVVRLDSAFDLRSAERACDGLLLPRMRPPKPERALPAELMPARNQDGVVRDLETDLAIELVFVNVVAVALRS